MSDLRNSNIISSVEIKLADDGRYRVSITKRFSPEYGGGESTITLSEPFYYIHDAARAAMSAVTLTKAHRTDFENDNY